MIDVSKLDPIGCGVIIEIEKQKNETKVGLIVVPETKDRLTTFAVGKMVKMGLSAFRYLDEDEKNFKIGDKVLFVKNSGISLSEMEDVLVENGENKEKEYRLVNDEDVRMVFKD